MSILLSGYPMLFILSYIYTSSLNIYKILSVSKRLGHPLNPNIPFEFHLKKSGLGRGVFMWSLVKEELIGFKLLDCLSN